ncbi:MAG: ORF6N domain-containing protein [Bacteriovorax sp.]|nr:ORF6N domain-containing protein [Bacteriovorax sp.]
MKFQIEKIEAMIYTIRGHRVMLDSDLAKLYGIETKRLKEQVKRNLDRFPQDFLIEPNSSELASLRSQIATLESSSSQNNTFKHAPFLFTENGVAMLSSVLQSKQAIQVNITIMRTFTKLRSFLVMGSSLKEEVGDLKTSTNQLFKIVFERLDNLEDQIAPKLPANRKKIGLKADRKY